MLHFESDYACGAHPAILQALLNTNAEQTPGYGTDAHCAHAAALLKERCQRPEADVHFVVGGTQANLTIIAAGLRPYEGVLCAETGHINVHETGAVEATGHKVLPLRQKDGKITAQQVKAAMEAHLADDSFEHTVRPGMVYLSQSTELGTLYTREELAEISQVCRHYGLMLFVDGARLVYALDAMPEVDLPFLAQACDAFTLGGTKVGLLFGEAIVLTNPELKRNFRYHIKQRGGMLAKGRLLGVQYEALLAGSLIEELGHHANGLACQIKAKLTELGCAFLCDTQSNQLFPILPDRVLEKLQHKYCFSNMGRYGEKDTAVRICTSVNTNPEEAQQLIADLEAAFRG